MPAAFCRHCLSKESERHIYMDLPVYVALFVGSVFALILLVCNGDERQRENLAGDPHLTLGVEGGVVVVGSDSRRGLFSR